MKNSFTFDGTRSSVKIMERYLFMVLVLSLLKSWAPARGGGWEGEQGKEIACSWILKSTELNFLFLLQISKNKIAKFNLLKKLKLNKHQEKKELRIFRQKNSAPTPRPQQTIISSIFLLCSYV